MKALLLSVVILIGGGTALAAETSKVVSIGGKEKWLTVGANHPNGIHLSRSGPASVTAATVKFPGGLGVISPTRDYMGTTIATVRTFPLGKRKGGEDSFSSEVNGWGYTWLTVERRPTKKRPNRVRWAADDLVSGFVVRHDCDGTFSFRSSNELTYPSVRTKRPVRWSFTLDGLDQANPIISSVHVSRRSKIGITTRTSPRLKLAIAKTVTTRETLEPFVRATLKNLGGRPARDLAVFSGVATDEAKILLGHVRRKRLAPLGPGSARKVKVPVARLPKGEYQLVVGASGSGTGTETVIRYFVEGAPG